MNPVCAIAAHATPAAPQPRLLQAAHEFEAQMMKELLQKMAGSGSILGDDDDSNSSQVLGEFAAEALGRGLSERGGFGIARRIVADLSQSSNPDPGGKVTKKVHGNTVIGDSK